MKRFVHRCLIGVAALAVLAHGQALAQTPVGGFKDFVHVSYRPEGIEPLPTSPADTSPAGALKPMSYAIQGTNAAFAGTETAAIMPPGAPASGDSRRVPLSVFWDDGLRFESSNDQFHLHLGGTIQVDSTWLIGPSSVFALPSGATNGVSNSSATFLRRARLRADGDIFDMFDFIIEYDFANASNENSGEDPASFSNLTSSPSPANVWMQIRDVPLVGYVRVGYQTKPVGMENNTSQANLPFLERADANDAIYAPFDGGYALGITARDWIESERLAWCYGIFRPVTNVFGVALNKYAYGARVTGLPWYEDNGQSLVHLGLGFWGGEIVSDELRLRARPLLRNGPGFAVPVLVDTGQIPGNQQYTIGPEFAMVQGPLTIQAEWAGQFLTDAVANGQPQSSAFFHGGYVEALWFLTGEISAYNKRDGVFGRVVPLNDYHLKRGDSYCNLGAWQVGARFSYVNLNDRAIQGGQMYDWTFGFTWFLNASMKFQLNYIVEHRDGPTGTPVGWINGIGARAAFIF
jgi:phosphate-selective porin OprO/OprP